MRRGGGTSNGSPASAVPRSSRAGGIVAVPAVTPSVLGQARRHRRCRRRRDAADAVITVDARILIAPKWKPGSLARGWSRLLFPCGGVETAQPLSAAGALRARLFLLARRSPYVGVALSAD